MQNKKLLLFLFLLIFLTGCSAFNFGKETSQRTSSEEITVQPQQPLPVDVVILLDQSGSMSGAMGSPATDPKNLRVDAVKYFINNFATKSDQKNPNRIGVINFGSNTPSDYLIPLTEVYFQNQKLVDDITYKIKPLNLGETNFINALKCAINEFQVNDSFSQSRRTAVVIFTDGEPYDSRKLSLSAYFDEIKTYISSNFPSNCQIFIVGIDDQQNTWSKTLPYWKQILPSNQILKINQMSDLQEAFNNIIRQIFQIPNVPPDIVGTSEKVFNVPPYIDTLELHAFFETKGVSLDICGPDNKPVDFKKTSGCFAINKGTYTIFIISEPTPGEWKYKTVGGKGTILIYKNFIPVKVNLISPQSPYPAFKKSKIIVEFLRSNGSEVISDPKYPLRIVASIKDSNGNLLFSSILDKTGFATYESSGIFSINQKGIYNLIFEVAGGTDYSYSYTKKIEVADIPYLIAIKPKLNSIIPISNSLNIEVGLEKSGKALNPLNEFENSPLLLVRAQLKKFPGEMKSNIEPKIIWLDPEKSGSNLFACNFPVSKAAEGKYSIYIALKGMSKTFGNYSDILIVDFEMKPSLLQTLFVVFKYVILFFVFLWVLQWVLFLSLRRNKMENAQINLFVRDEQGEMQILSQLLSGKKYVLIKLSPKYSFGKAVNIPKGFVFVYGKKSNINFVYFNNLINYFLFPYVTAVTKRKKLTHGLETKIKDNLYINII
ncbi:MAG: vWA domain-containing protein [archaeon]